MRHHITRLAALLVLGSTALTSACSGPPPPEPDPGPAIEAPAAPQWPELTWGAHRNPQGRFGVDLPGTLHPSKTKALTVDHRQLQVFRNALHVDDDHVMFEVNWALFPDPPTEPLRDTDLTDTDVPSLVVPADAPPEALLDEVAKAAGGKKVETTTLDGRPARVWKGRNFGKHWTGAVVLGPDRYYILRVRNRSKERFEEAHDKLVSSFRLLTDLTPEEEGLTAARVEEERKQADEAARVKRELADAKRKKEEAIARGEIPADEEVLKYWVMLQAGSIRCFTTRNRGGVELDVRVSVDKGKVRSVSVFQKTGYGGFGSGGRKRKVADDELQWCIKSGVAGMSFPEDLSAAADVPLTLTQGYW